MPKGKKRIYGLDALESPIIVLRGKTIRIITARKVIEIGLRDESVHQYTKELLLPIDDIRKEP